MKFLLFLLATTTPLLACFVAPAENVLLFRRDALPLDSNRQQLLSKDLIVLATRPTALKNPLERRTTAQLLALAFNFDPNSKSPRHLGQAFTNALSDGDGDSDELSDHLDLKEPLANLSATILYLLKKADDPEQQSLAQLLLDPLSHIAPDLDVVSAKPSAEESPKWKRAVAPLSHFIVKEKTLPAEPAEGEEAEEDMLAEEKQEEVEVEPEEKELKQVAPFQGSIQVPLFVLIDPEDESVLFEAEVQKLQFQAKLKEKPARIKTPFSRKSENLSYTLNRIQTILGKSHGMETIVRIDGNFDVNKRQISSQSGRVLGFPIALLLEGLLSERQPLENLTVLGVVTPEGQIKAPKVSWQFLEALVKNENKDLGRLLVSSELRPLLESVLTQQKEDFFFAYDIFEVSTLEEAYELAFEDASPENTFTAIEKFQEIRRVGSGKTTSVFVANPHVLARLEEVVQIEPRLLSASFLKMRGESKHPAKHSSEVLAALIQSALAPMARIPYSNSRYLNSEELERIHSQCRLKLDSMTRHIARADSQTYDDAMDLANRLRTLARAKERISQDGSFNDGSSNSSIFFSTFKAIQEEYYALALETCTLLGQEPPANPSKSEN